MFFVHHIHGISHNTVHECVCVWDSSLWAWNCNIEAYMHRLRKQACMPYTTECFDCTLVLSVYWSIWVHLKP